MKVPLTPGQKDALTSFQYNTGGLAGSTLLERLNAGDATGAAREFDGWNKITDEAGNKVVSAGLTKRRAAERGMFEGDHPANLAALEPLDGVLAKVDKAAAGQPVEVLEKAQHLAIARFNELQHLTASARADFEAGLTDKLASAQSGNVDVTPPDFVGARRYYTAEQMGDMLGRWDAAKLQGQAVNDVKLASPDQIAAQSTVNWQGTKDPSATDFKDKVARAVAYDRAAKQRADQLDDDPAAYVAGNAPAVRAAFAAVDPKSPAAGTQAAVTSSLAEQARLGVPEDERRVLTDGQAERMVQKIVSAPSAQTDVGRELDGMAQTYGPHWQRAFGDLVEAGLPADYQVLAAMDAPGQAVARADLQRVLALEAEKGGAAKIKEDAPKEAVAAITKGIDDSLADFRATVRWNDGGEQLYNAVKSSVSKLAYGYAMRDMDGDTALKAATDGILNAKYDFDGTIRAPKGTMASVKQAGLVMLNELRPADLAPVPGNPDLTLEQRQQAVIEGARRGAWVPNADDTGLVLMARYRDGAMIPVKLANGQAVGFSFSNAAGIAARQPAGGNDFTGGP